MPHPVVGVSLANKTAGSPDAESTREHGTIKQEQSSAENKPDLAETACCTCAGSEPPGWATLHDSPKTTHGDAKVIPQLSRQPDRNQTRTEHQAKQNKNVTKWHVTPEHH